MIKQSNAQTQTQLHTHARTPSRNCSRSPLGQGASHISMPEINMTTINVNGKEQTHASDSSGVNENGESREDLYRRIAELKHEVLMLNKELEAREDDSYLDREITRLTRENLHLRAQKEVLNAPTLQELAALETIGPYSNAGAYKTLKDSQLKLAKSNSSGLSGPDFGFQTPNTSGMSLASMSADVKSQAMLRGDRKGMSGALQFSPDKDNLITKYLVLELDPRQLLGQPAGLVAHILFMCVRYLDLEEERDRMKGLCKSLLLSVKSVLLNNSSDVDRVVFWLSTCSRFLSDLKQYSGEAMYGQQDEGKPLKNFDLSDFRRQVTQLCIAMQRRMLDITQKDLAVLAPAGILEHQALDLGEDDQDSTNRQPVDRRYSLTTLEQPVTATATATATVAAKASRNKSASDMLTNRNNSTTYSERAAEAERQQLEMTETDLQSKVSVDDLIQYLQWLADTMNGYYLAPDMVAQILGILMDYIAVVCTNEMLQKPSICTDLRGLQISFNLQALSSWWRDQPGQGKAQLLTLTQAARLLTMPKSTVEDIQLICDQARALNVSRLQRLLHMYRDPEGNPIPASILQAGLEQRWLHEQRRVEEPPPLMLQPKPPGLTVSYTAKDIKLEDLVVPSFLRVPFLVKV